MPGQREAPSAASVYLREVGDWPQSWMGEEKDLPPGQALVNCLRPFLEHLARSGLSPKTIRRHISNVWLLGGEIIRDVHIDSAQRRVASERLVRKAVDEEGGPLLYHGSEDEQRSFDSTCRKLHRFLAESGA